jgi:hypothetical protein
MTPQDGQNRVSRMLTLEQSFRIPIADIDDGEPAGQAGGDQLGRHAQSVAAYIENVECGEALVDLGYERRVLSHAERQQWIIKALQLNQDQFECPCCFE